MNLSLTDIKSLKKERATKMLQELGLQVTEEVDLEFYGKNLGLIKINLDVGLSLGNIFTTYKNWIVQMQSTKQKACIFLRTAHL